MAAPFELPERPRILVIVLRRIGDVLLTTPLLRTLRRGYPAASIDVLAFSGTEGILQGNPDVDAVVSVPQRPSMRETVTLIARLLRKYDLVVSTQAGDRPAFLALAASGARVGIVPAAGDGAWWKRRVFQRAVPAVQNQHRIEEVLRLAVCLGLTPQREVVCPSDAARGGTRRDGPYAVIHATPMFRYRRWTNEGWRGLVRALKERGLSVLATGGPDPSERAYLDGLLRLGDASVERLDGRLTWPELAALLGGASVYVGPDTSMTHLAAAAGCPTVALFGPTDPRLWGPWPSGGLDRAWDAAGSIQRRGNVWLVQNALPCTPCQREGCERHLDSASACLDGLSLDRVLSAVDKALEVREASGAPMGWREASKASMEAGMTPSPVKP
ncbi:MAG: glycosyltransferase family 9 protein [Alphaproteobacteria bacterium]|nr:glycosyltransferase family 9 protein [Alphaproteobacteria bacterium]